MSLAARPGNFGTRFHNFLYQKLNLNYIYKAFTTTDIRAAIGGIRALGVRGCAISMPFKEVCMEYLDAIEPSAKGIQSVNTIVNDDGKLSGSNTDYTAVRQLLQLNDISPASSFALYGSGGMAKAVACALTDLGFKYGTIVARNEKAGKTLADQYGLKWSPSVRSGTSLLINASPIGMAGAPEESSLPFSKTQIQEATTIFDVVAIPIETPLIQAARAQNKKIISGFEVTTLQALEQFVLYTGVRPDSSMVKEAALFARN